MTRRFEIVTVVALVAASCLAGCSGNSSAVHPGEDDAGPDAHARPLVRHDSSVGIADGDSGQDVGLMPGNIGDGGSLPYDTGTFHALPPPPRVQNADGGTLGNPTIVAVFFANEDQTLLPTLEKFYMGIGASEFWKPMTEYGIGVPTASVTVLTEMAPATIDDTPDNAGDNTDLENWLLAEITSNALPAPTPTTEYVINYPAGTTVTSDGNQCVDFDGYHSDVATASGTLVAYAVVPRCTDMGSTLLETFGSTASHELIEAATDPYPDYQPGWAQVDNAHLFWDEANTGSEIGDMCQDDPEAYYQFSDFPFTVQRFWSNASALAGHDPCVPEIPGATFFNAVPELPDTGLFDYYGATVTVDSVHIAVGQSKTIYVDVYSDGKLGDWDVAALDYNYYFGATSSSAPLLTFEMPKTTGNNGDRLPVTITVVTAGNPNTNGQTSNTELFFIESSQGTNDNAPAHYWYGIVTN